MIGQFLLTFREVLEAALVTSIILAYLIRTNRRVLTRYVWLGVSAATLASLVVGTSIWLTYGLLSKPIQALFEGVAALLAVAVLSSMIFWLATKGKEIREEVERRVEAIATRGTGLALASFSFVVVFREGLETVLFLTPLMLRDFQGTVVGAALGILASLALSYGLFVVGMRINLRSFFYFTSTLLVLLAGGLAGYGVHELIEYAQLADLDLGWFARYAYRLDIHNGSPFHHKGLVGSVLAVMFGYTVNPEWGRLIVHLVYLALAPPLVMRVYQER